VRAANGFTASEILALAASVERGSGHLLARSVVQAAENAGLELNSATEVREAAGRGVAGRVNERVVHVGARTFIDEHLGPTASTPSSALPEAGLRAHVAVDGEYAGCIEFADQMRPGLSDLFAALRRAGIRRCLLLSGDSTAHTEAVAAMVGLSEARGELLPADKVRVVADLIARGERVLMVGDGTNDAPALSTATVGVALAGHGGGITAEAADVVILNDDLSRVPEAIEISRRTLRIARQSIWTGLGLSAVAMLAAAGGHIPPAVGALLQEGIDVAVILNALRSSAQPRSASRERPIVLESRMEHRNVNVGTSPITASATNSTPV
jgi:P-type E1-E2 ATPase